jgi:hypothetical protein
MRSLNTQWWQVRQIWKRRRAAKILACANTARDRRNWLLAEKFYIEHLRFYPLSAPILVQLGHSLREQSRIDEAHDAYRRAVSIAPEDPDTQLQFARSLAQLGDTSGASIAYKTAIELDPRCEDARNELQHLALLPRRFSRPNVFGQQTRELKIRADSARDNKDWRKAEALYRQAIELWPDSGWMVQRGHCLKEMFKYTEAELSYRDARAHGAPDFTVTPHLEFVAARNGWSSQSPIQSSIVAEQLIGSDTIESLLQLLLPEADQSSAAVLQRMRDTPTLDSAIAAILLDRSFTKVNHNSLRMANLVSL